MGKRFEQSVLKFPFGFLKLNFSGFVKTISAPLEQKSEISGRKIAKAVRFVPTQKKGVGFFLAKASNFSRRRENLAFVPEFQYATMLQMLDKAQVKNGSMQD